MTSEVKSVDVAPQDGNPETVVTKTPNTDGTSTEVTQLDPNSDGKVDQVITEVKDADGKVLSRTEETTTVNADGSTTTVTKEDKDADGTPEKVTSVTEYPNGNTQTVVSEDTDDSGSVDKVTTENRDADGNLLSRTEETVTQNEDGSTTTVTKKDVDGDGVVDETTTETVNKDGSSTTVTEKDTDGDGKPDETTTSETTPPAEDGSVTTVTTLPNGNIATTVTEKADADGNVKSVTEVRTPAPENALVSKEEKVTKADGSSDAKVTYADGTYSIIADDGKGTVTTTNYTADGKVTSEVKSVDVAPQDGNPEQLTETVYHADGTTPKSVTEETDVNSDGVPEQKVVRTFDENGKEIGVVTTDYNAQGSPVKEVAVEKDASGNVLSTTTTEAEYAADGVTKAKETVTVESTTPADANPESVKETVYHADGTTPKSITASTDANSDGKFDTVSKQTFDENGALVAISDSKVTAYNAKGQPTKAETVEKDGSGNVLSTTTTETEYAADGVTKAKETVTVESSTPADAHPESVTETVYATDGSKVVTVTTDTNSDGNPDSVKETRYDNAGNVVGSTETTYSDYNAQGNPAKAVEVEKGASGNVLSTTTTATEYAADGVTKAKETVTVESSTPADAHPESVTETVYATDDSKVVTVTTDSNSDGNPDSVKETRYDNADNVVGSTETTYSDYNAQDNPAKAIAVEKDASGNVLSTTTTATEYAADGETKAKETVTVESSTPADDKPESVKETVYHANGTQKTVITTTDNLPDGNADGNPDKVVKETYDEQGALIGSTETTYSDYNAQGNPAKTVEVEKDASGNVLSTTTTATEYAADGETKAKDTIDVVNADGTKSHTEIAYNPPAGPVVETTTEYAAGGTVTAEIVKTTNEDGSSVTVKTTPNGDGTNTVVTTTDDGKGNIMVKVDDGKGNVTETTETVETVTNDDGSTTTTRTIFDEDGKKVQTVATTVGTDGSIKVETTNFDPATGKETGSVVTNDADGNGFPEEKVTYDANGREVKREEDADNNGGTPTRVLETTRDGTTGAITATTDTAYNSDGSEKSVIETAYSGALGEEKATSATTTTQLADGGKEVSVDGNADGKPETVTTTNGQGKPTKVVNDANSDGKPESVVETVYAADGITPVSQTTTEYAADGVTPTKQTTVTYAADGSVEKTEVTTFNAQGNPTKVETYNGEADTTPDKVVATEYEGETDTVAKTTTTDYVAGTTKPSKVVEVTPSGTTETTTTYNAAGNPTQVVETVKDAQGTVTATTVTNTTYDATGTVKQSEVETETVVSPEAKKVVTETAFTGEAGNEKPVTQTVTTDNGNNGTTDQETVIRYDENGEPTSTVETAYSDFHLVSGKPQTVVVTEKNADGEPTKVTTTETVYDANGTVKQSDNVEVVTLLPEADKATVTTATTYTGTVAGAEQPVKATVTTDKGSDGNVDSVKVTDYIDGAEAKVTTTETTYDETGAKAQTVETVETKLPEAEVGTVTTTTEFDGAKGAEVATTETVVTDKGNDGVENKVVTEFAADGETVAKVTTTDYTGAKGEEKPTKEVVAEKDASGENDIKVTETAYTYDEAGNIKVISVDETQAGQTKVDGYPELETKTTYYPNSVVAKTVEVTEDSNSDGYPDKVTVTSYDASGKQTGVVVTDITYQEGEPGAKATVTETTYAADGVTKTAEAVSVFNEDGSVTKSIDDKNDTVDGSVDRIEKYSSEAKWEEGDFAKAEDYVYNTEGKVIQTTYDDNGDTFKDRIAYDSNANGKVELVEHYNTDGGITQRDIDSNDDGVVDRITYDQDANGRNEREETYLGQTLVQVKIDRDDDGQFDEVRYNYNGDSAGHFEEIRYYTEGTLTHTAYDDDPEDGTIDRIEYVDGSEVKTKVLKDTNGDGISDIFYDNDGNGIFDKVEIINEKGQVEKEYLNQDGTTAGQTVDGVEGVNAIVVHEYNDKGEKVKSTFNDDALGEAERVEVYRYDENGNLVQTGFDSDADTSTGNAEGFNKIEYYSYDSAGNRIAVRTDSDADSSTGSQGQTGVEDGVDIITRYGYENSPTDSSGALLKDKEGNTIASSISYDTDANGEANSTVTHTAFDRYGNPTRTEVNSDATGEIERVEQSEYDANGLKAKTRFYNDGDDSDDLVNGIPKADLIEAYHYNAKGQLTGKDIDSNGDGKVDIVESYELDSQGRVIQTTYSTPEGATANGNYTGTTPYAIDYFVLDANGNVEKKYTNTDAKSTGTTEAIVINGISVTGIDKIESNRLDSKGQVIEKAEDKNADGTIDAITYYERNANGHIIQTYFDMDANAKEGVAEKDITGATRTINGEVVKGIDRVEKYDVDANGRTKVMYRDNEPGTEDTYNYREMYSRDANGNITETRYDMTNDGHFDKVEVNTYNARGGLIETKFYNVVTEGSESREIITKIETYLLNNNDQQTQKSINQGGNNSIDSIEHYKLDPQGNIIETRFDTGANNSTDRREVYTRNANGHMTQKDIYIGESITRDSYETYDIDALGRQTRIVSVDGQSVTIVEKVFDQNDNVTIERRYTDGIDDKIPNSVFYNEYNEKNQKIAIKWDRDGNGYKGYNPETEQFGTDNDRYSIYKFDDVGNQTYEKFFFGDTAIREYFITFDDSNRKFESTEHLTFRGVYRGATQLIRYEYDSIWDKVTKETTIDKASGKVTKVTERELNGVGEMTITLTDTGGDGTIERLSFGTESGTNAIKHTEDLTQWTEDKLARFKGALTTVTLSDPTAASTLILNKQVIAKIASINKVVTIDGDATDNVQLSGFVEQSSSTKEGYKQFMADDLYTIFIDEDVRI